MARLAAELRKAILTDVGSYIHIKKTITSSAITTSAQALTSVASGQLEIVQIIVKTDSTGLAGGTNFVISSDNAKGVVNILVETIANLGASISKTLMGNSSAADTTTSDATPTVTALATVLEAGKKLQFNNTAAAGTGAGTIDVHIVFRRLDRGAQITAA